MSHSEVRMVYVLRNRECRPAFLDLMSELKTVTTELMAQAGASPAAYTLTERRDREGFFVEVLRFAGPRERDKFDRLYCDSRRTSAIHALIDDLVDASRSDYVVT
jgi:hypothetical protein